MTGFFVMYEGGVYTRTIKNIRFLFDRLFSSFKCDMIGLYDVGS